MTYKQYYHFINEIRIKQNMTIASLCDGITSERTFLRYLKSNKAVKFDVLSKLCKRLNIQASSIVHNAVFFRTDGNSSYKFIYRVQVMHFNDIEEHYQNVLSQNDLVWYLHDCLQAHITKYECMIGRIDPIEYRNRLHELYVKSVNSGAINAEILMIDVFYLETNPPKSQELAVFIAKELLSVDFMSSILFHALAISRFLSIALKTNYLDLDTFRKLVQRLQIINGYISTKYIQVHLALYLAYLAKQEDNPTEMQKYVFLYHSTCRFLYGGKDYFFEKTEIEKMFNVDLLQLEIEKTKEAFASNRFVCIK
jgi:DNA-binding Xre family transcriptional regulator